VRELDLRAVDVRDYVIDHGATFLDGLSTWCRLVTRSGGSASRDRVWLTRRWRRRLLAALVTTFVASTERRADRESEDEGSPSHARTISQLSPASTPRRAVLRLACPTEARSKLQGPQSLGHQAGDQPVVGPARRRGGVGE